MEKRIKLLLDSIKLYRPEKVILFGSGAKGTFQKTSDLDILVIKRTNEPFWERQKKLASLISGDFDVDAFVMTPEEVERALKAYQPFVYDIITQGKVIYGEA